MSTNAGVPDDNRATVVWRPPVAPVVMMPAATPGPARWPEPAAAGAERELFRSGNVRVTTSRFIVPSKTYAISGVTSVGTRTDKPSMVPVVFMLLGSVFLVVCAFAAQSAWLGALAAGALLIAVMLAVLRKAKHHVVLRTAGGEVRPLTSLDGEHIANIVSALNDAIVARG